MDTSLQTVPLIFSTPVCTLSSPSQTEDVEAVGVGLPAVRTGNTGLGNTLKTQLTMLSHLIHTLHRPYRSVSPVFHHRGVYSCISLGFCHISLEDFELVKLESHLVMPNANRAAHSSQAEIFVPETEINKSSMAIVLSLLVSLAAEGRPGCHTGCGCSFSPALHDSCQHNTAVPATHRLLATRFTNSQTSRLETPGQGCTFYALHCTGFLIKRFRM